MQDLRMSMFGFAPWNAINFASYNIYKEAFIDYERVMKIYINYYVVVVLG